MYIPEFVCGILVTLIFEVLAAVLYSIFKNDKKEGDVDAQKSKE